MKWFMWLVMVLCLVGLACPCQASTNNDGLNAATIDGLEINNTREYTIDKEITAPAEVPIDVSYVGIFRPFAGSCANGACGMADSGPRPVVGAVRNTGRAVGRAVRWAARPFANARARRVSRRC